MLGPQLYTHHTPSALCTNSDRRVANPPQPQAAGFGSKQPLYHTRLLLAKPSAREAVCGTITILDTLSFGPADTQEGTNIWPEPWRGGPQASTANTRPHATRNVFCCCCCCLRPVRTEHSIPWPPSISPQPLSSTAVSLIPDPRFSQTLSLTSSCRLFVWRCHEETDINRTRPHLPSCTPSPTNTCPPIPSPPPTLISPPLIALCNTLAHPLDPDTENPHPPPRPARCPAGSHDPPPIVL